MSGFLYYLPNPAPRVPALDQAKARGIGYAFDGPPERDAVYNGPDGGSGLLLAHRDTVRRLGRSFGYYADLQRWQKINVGDPDDRATHVWVGYDNSQKPQPIHLERADGRPGPAVLLADGNHWIVPRACVMEEGESGMLPTILLPRSIDLDQFGDWILSGVTPRFKGLWTIAIKWMDARLRTIATAANRMNAMQAGDEVNQMSDVEIPFDNPYHAAIEVLSFNYRIGMTEAVMLGLFHLRGPEAPAILDACCDAETLDAWIAENADAVINMPEAELLNEPETAHAATKEETI